MFQLEGKTRGFNILIDTSKEKILNAISYLSEKVKNPTKLKIFKLLFFLDFESFVETGYPVTDLQYYAWKRGPVPKDLYHEFENNKIFEGFFEINSRGKFKSLKNYDLSVFSESEFEIIEKIIKKYKNTSDKELSEITHKKGSPWEQTNHNEKISYLLAFEDKSGIITQSTQLSKEEAEEIYSNYLEFKYNYG